MEIFNNRKFRTILCLVLLSFTTVGVINANYIKLDHKDLNLDMTIAPKVQEYAIPEALVIVPIIPPSQDFNVETIDWYRGMYYYQTTRYNLPDISFHYLISNDGKLIDNDLSILDRKIVSNVDGIQNPILVGYMSAPGEIGFKPLSKEKVAQMILDIINKNNIPLENIYIKNIKFSQVGDRQLDIQLVDPFITWKNELTDIKNVIEVGYNPVQREYKVEIVSIDTPQEEFEVGQEIEVGIRIKNTGHNSIYKDTSSEILLSKEVKPKEAGASIFYINNEWASQTQAYLMQSGSGSILLPATEVEFKLKAKVPYSIGEVKENFIVTNVEGDQISSNSVELKIMIKKPEGEIVEILDTGAGYLKVRSGPTLDSKELTRVSPGERFFLVDSKPGWNQIKVNQDISGWVSSKYTKKIL